MKIPLLSLTAVLCIYIQVAICKQRLDILGLYPKSGNGWTEPFVEYSAELALKHIQQNGTILTDYELVIDWKNTECNGGIALKEFVDALGYQTKTYMAVFGGGCAVATSQVAALSYRYGLAQIAYASTAPNLGNRNLYPKFVRGVPSDLNAVPARARFIQQNNWKRVAIINEQDPIFVASSHFMETVLDKLNVDYRVEDFAPDGTLPLEQQVSTIADNLRGNGYRIIIANMYEDAAIKIFCELHKKGENYLLPPIATWIFLGWFTDQWHKKQDVLDEVGCTAEQVAEISNGALGFLGAHSENNFRGETEDNEQPNIVNKSTAEIYQEYKSLALSRIGDDIVRFEKESDRHDAYVYDSIWTLALALQDTVNTGMNLTEISQENILQANSIYFSEDSDYSNAVYTGMLKQNFIGWSGKVEFYGHERFYDRVQVLEFVNGSLIRRGECENIPYYENYTDDTINQIMCIQEDYMYFNVEAATDGIENTHVHIAIISIGILLSFCIVAYVTILIVVIIVGKFQKLESIKNSSPILTCIILTGNYLLILAGVFYVTNDRIVEHDNSGFMGNIEGEPATTEVCETANCKLLCMLPVSLLLVASSLIFGGMIGKASLIYLLAVKLRFDLGQKVRLLVQFAWPLLFTCVDIIFVIIWSLVSSLVMKSEVLPAGSDITPFISVIQCGISAQQVIASDVFIGLLIIYKIFIVLIGLVMAYNLRNVKIKSLQYWGTITWTMYNMTIFTLVLILSFFLIQDYVTKRAVLPVLILITVILTASITGLPPVYYRFRDPHLTQNVFMPSGLRVEIRNDEVMLKNQVAALQSDRTELKSEIEDLKSTNSEIIRRMTSSEEIFLPPIEEKTPDPTIEEKTPDPNN
ncbi:gamma-aminobutyric acid (GABA) type B receptor [Oopsacas minuta]|uniref:Gamma-aminobutyric acid (GABA) type B receptor n=1 Tax=Oopsacas minuta TaxID=111878 RepID=A0AAV7KB83_9METZ|nr:gamma-aminobutyric acid (GABA) type B receptor [Oopsacas minuta]